MGNFKFEPHPRLPKESIEIPIHVNKGLLSLSVFWKHKPRCYLAYSSMDENFAKQQKVQKHLWHFSSASPITPLR